MRTTPAQPVVSDDSRRTIPDLLRHSLRFGSAICVLLLVVLASYLANDTLPRLSNLARNGAPNVRGESTVALRPFAADMISFTLDDGVSNRASLRLRVHNACINEIQPKALVDAEPPICGARRTVILPFTGSMEGPVDVRVRVRAQSRPAKIEIDLVHLDPRTALVKTGVVMLLSLLVGATFICGTRSLGPSPRDEKNIFSARDYAVLSAAAALGSTIRWYGLTAGTGDLNTYLQWLKEIEASGWPALGVKLGVYSPAYYYVLAVAGLLKGPFSPVAAVKIPTYCFDLALAWGAYELVRVITGMKDRALWAGIATFLSPIVLMNSALWAQSDSIYAAFALWTLVFLAKGAERSAAISYGAAIAFKAQAGFIVVVPIVLFLRRSLSGLFFVRTAGIYLLMLLPAWIFGREFLSVAGTYVRQAESRIVRGAIATPPALSSAFGRWAQTNSYKIGALSVIAALLILTIARARTRPRFDAAEHIHLVVASAFLVPFLIPNSGCRYFYLGQLLLLLYAFIRPRYAGIAIIVLSAAIVDYSVRLSLILPVPPAITVGIAGLTTAFMMYSLSRPATHRTVLDDGAREASSHG